MFKKILIANRGEIACRIARTCQTLGIGSVAVYSSADAGALHTRLADEAVPIGGAESRDSYLVIERIIAAARDSGAEAVHPGYGFLSENPAFAEALQAAGLTLIGPSAAVIARMGDKIEAKALAARAAVPLVPGITLAATTADAPENIHAVEAFATQHGFPILIKAASGGGGRGMRRVSRSSDIPSALAGAAREALAFFADGRIFVEKLIEDARHIEVQIMGDRHGTVRVFGDRDCSLQRNHQKVIEEAPAANIPAELRATIHAAAQRLGEVVGYQNAGTVEFLLDRSHNFYFLEVNSRLQVEHPVTEAVTGLDLVEIQIRLAAGESLAALLPHGTPEPCGAAIECRICAESPAENFTASTGRLERLAAPLGRHIRFDTGFETGDTITHYYDSLLGKLIVTAPTRAAAIDASIDALHAIDIDGVKTNIGFLLALLDDSTVRSFGHHTNYAASLVPTPAARQRELRVNAAAILLDRWREHSGAPLDRWQANDGFRLSGAARTSGSFSSGGENITATLIRRGPTAFRLDVAGGTWRIDGVAFGPSGFQFTLDGRIECARVYHGHHGAWVKTGRGTFLVEERSVSLKRRESDTVAEAREIRSPLPGKVIKVTAAVGDTLNAGDTVLVIESMKMEHLLRAPAGGKVKAIKALQGDVVEAQAVLVELDF